MVLRKFRGIYHEMKRIILNSIYFVVISFGLLFMLNCENTNDKKKFKIGFSQCLSDHPYRNAMNHSMEVQASVNSKIDLKIYQANGNMQKQIQQIEEMIDNHYIPMQ